MEDSNLHELDAEIDARMQLLIERRERFTPEVVRDYAFEGPNGPVMLSELFGAKTDLLLIHNMGRSCPYCTLWADGFTGYMRHFDTRTAFVLVSPDSPAVQAEVAAERGWKFPMVQDATKEFTTDMKMYGERGYWPGASGFSKKADGTIVRTGVSSFGPGDQVCMVWPLFELLADGANGWEPN